MIKRKLKKQPKIEFITEEILYGVVADPVPAIRHIPEWFRKLKPVHMDSNPGQVTIKRCVPFLDALGMGYIIPTPVKVDITLAEKPEDDYFTWGGAMNPVITNHADGQTQGSGWIGTYKFENPWTIRTPPGYSCLFLPPLNRPSMFQPVAGIVDTDTYFNRINIPFQWTVPRPWRGIIDAGEPLVQVIPFKRDEWDYELRSAEQEELMAVNKVSAMVNSRDRAYKRIYHHKGKGRSEQA